MPILYDKKTKRIVSNESAEIIRMLSEHAQMLGSSIPADDRFNLYPSNQSIRNKIDELNSVIYTTINNGAYKAGFSSDQAVYAQAFEMYFDTLASLETLLSTNDGPYLTGQAFTEADLRLFPIW